MAKTLSRNQKILAVPALADLQLEVPVGRGDHPGGAALLAAAPEAAEAARVEEGEQLCLQRQWQLADLVEEQRSPAGHLHQAAASRLRVGERSLLVSEELGFDRRLGERRAVHVNERSVLAGPERVHMAREHLLPCAGGPEEEHRAPGGGRDAAEHLQHLPHRRRPRRDESAAPGQLGLHAAQALAEVLLTHGPLGAHRGIRQVHRLCHVVRGAGADGVHRALDVPVRGHHHRSTGKLRLQLGEVIQPVTVREAAVEHDQLGRGALHRLARLVQRARRPHRMPLAGERFLRQRGKATESSSTDRMDLLMRESFPARAAP